MSRIFIDLNKFNWIYSKATLKFKSITQDKYDKFLKYCEALKNLNYIIKCIGLWDIELDFEIENFNKFHAIMFNIRSNFAEIIKNYDFVIVMN